ncbi:hypothetical protein ACP70R_043161 [Stipagrostis hirtigluma subsp. patula]
MRISGRRHGVGRFGRTAQGQVCKAAAQGPTDEAPAWRAVRGAPAASWAGSVGM